MLFDSVAPDVKIISLGSAPMSFATCARAFRRLLLIPIQTHASLSGRFRTAQACRASSRLAREGRWASSPARRGSLACPQERRPLLKTTTCNRRSPFRSTIPTNSSIERLPHPSPCAASKTAARALHHRTRPQQAPLHLVTIVYYRLHEQKKLLFTFQKKNKKEHKITLRSTT